MVVKTAAPVNPRLPDRRNPQHDGTITLEGFAPHREYLLPSLHLLRRWWEQGWGVSRVGNGGERR
jgi:hypothetical protein